MNRELSSVMLNDAAFVSFNCVQRQLVSDFCQFLVPKGFFSHILVDFDKTPDSVSTHFEEAILISDFAIIFVSNEYKNSKTCEQEAKFIISNRKPTVVAKIHPATDDWVLADGFSFIQQVVLMAPGQSFDEAAELLAAALEKCSRPATSDSRQQNASELEFSSSKKHQPKTVAFIDVPKLAIDCYFSVHQQIDFLHKLRTVSNSVENTDRVLLVTGTSGVGKTTLIAESLIGNGRFLQEGCWIDVVFWVQCSSWSQDQFFEQVVRKFAKVTSWNPMSSRILLVLDDVDDESKVFPTFAEHFPNATTVAIMRHAEVFLSQIGARETYQVAPLDEATVTGLLAREFNLAGKLERSQLEMLAKICDGLPVAIRIVASRFRNRIKSSHCKASQTEFDTLKSQLYPSSEKIISEPGLIGNGKSRRRSRMKPKIVSGNLLANFLEFCLEREDEAFRVNFYEFLLFEPSEPVGVDALSLLWRCASQHQALVRCQQFARKGLATSVSLRDDHQTVEMFQVSRIVFEALLSNAISTHHFGSNLDEVRVKIANGACDANGKLGAVMFEAVGVGCWSLVAKLVERLDADTLFQVCQQQVKPSAAVGSPMDLKFLHLLYNSFQLVGENVGEHERMWAENPAFKLLARIFRKIVGNPNIANLIGETDASKNSLLLQIFDEEDEPSFYHDRRLVVGVARSVVGLESAYARAKWAKIAVENVNKNGKLFLAAVKGDVVSLKNLIGTANTKQLAEFSEGNKRGETALMAAAAGGNVAVLVELANRIKGSAEIYDKRGWSPMTHAAASGQLEAVDCLLKVAPTTRDTKDLTDGSTPLMVAAKNGHLEIVGKLLENDQGGATLTTRNQAGATPLIVAARYGRLDVVRFLVGASPETTRIQDGTGSTAFLEACQFGHVDVAKSMLLLEPAVISDCDHRGRNALAMAAQNGQLEIVRFLLFYLDSNNNNSAATLIDHLNSDADSTALMLAAENGHCDVVRFLAGFEPKTTNATDRNGQNALIRAVARNQLEVVKFLLEFEPSGDGQNKMNAFFLAAKLGHCEVANILSQSIGDGNGKTLINSPNKNGVTATMLAAQNGHVDVVAFLYEQLGKAALIARDVDGITPLMLAAENGHLALMQFFIEKQPDALTWRDNFGRSVLMFAAAKGHLDVVRLLCESYPAMINCQAEHGETSLMFAAHYRHEATATFLAEKDPAGVQITNEDGCNAVMVAVEVGSNDVTQKLARLHPDPIGYCLFITKYTLDSLGRDADAVTLIAFKNSLATLRVLTFEDADRCQQVLASSVLKEIFGGVTGGWAGAINNDHSSVTTTADQNNPANNDLEMSVFGLLSNISEFGQFLGEVANLPRLVSELVRRLKQERDGTSTAMQLQLFAANIAANLLLSRDDNSNNNNTNGKRRGSTVIAANNQDQNEVLQQSLSGLIKRKWKEFSINGNYPIRKSMTSYVGPFVKQGQCEAVRRFGFWSLYLALTTGSRQHGTSQQSANNILKQDGLNAVVKEVLSSSKKQTDPTLVEICKEITSIVK